MDGNLYKSELRKIKLKQRQLATKLKVFMSQDVSLLDSASFDNQLKSMDAVCYDITDQMDEMIMDLEEADDDENDSRISDLEEMKETVLKTLMSSKEELMLNRNKKDSSTDNEEVVQNKNDEELDEDVTDKAEKSEIFNRNTPDLGSLKLGSKSEKTLVHNLGVGVAKRAVKKAMVKEEAADFIGEGIAELITENPTEVVLDLVLGSIGEQLGVKGTGGFFAAALTHYAICQFAVLIGIATSPLKMDFSGITQAKILKKLEDLNKKVDKLLNSPRVEALKHLKNGLLELQNKKINFLEARKRFEKVQDSATKALAREEDFNHMAVCTKYLLFAETMVHSFTEDYTEGGTNYGDCFLPIEKMTEDRKDRMVTFLVSQVKELKSQMATKGKKKDDHRDKVDDILKMVYNIISVCKNLSNPNTLINNAITFGIDTDFVPFGEEDATVLQVGRDTTDTEYLNPKEISDQDMKQMPAYTVYVWMKEEKKLCVRRALKVFDISTQYVHGSLVWVNLEETDGKLGCKYGAKKEGPFEMTIFPRNGYPKYIQRMDVLFKTAKAAKDMDSLPKDVYDQMQRISEVYLADLGIDVNEKDDKEKTLLHYVACLKPGRSSGLTPIDCLVDAGADLASEDSEGRTPLMNALVQGAEVSGLMGNPLETNIKHLISLCEGTPALNAVDKRGNNVLHIAASIKESRFTKEIVKLLLKVDVNATHVNSEDFIPRDSAHHHQNFGVHKILKANLSTD